jgi:Flp pilus assembly protein TadG
MIASRGRRRGGTAIEFALLLPVFVLLVSGILDVSWLYFRQSALDVAVHDGCRHGSLRDPGIGNASMNAVLDDAESAMSASMTDMGVPCGECTVAATSVMVGTESSVQCSVRLPFVSLVGVVAPPVLSSTVTMRLEMQR